MPRTTNIQTQADLFFISENLLAISIVLEDLDHDEADDSGEADPFDDNRGAQFLFRGVVPWVIWSKQIKIQTPLHLGLSPTVPTHISKANELHDIFNGIDNGTPSVYLPSIQRSLPDINIFV
jgi:hypothetical protein